MSRTIESLEKALEKTQTLVLEKDNTIEGLIKALREVKNDEVGKHNGNLCVECLSKVTIAEQALSICEKEKHDTR